MSKNSREKLGFYAAIGYNVVKVENHFHAIISLAGYSSKSGFRNDHLALARFGEITGIIESPRSWNYLWIADSTNCCIRNVNLKTNEVATVAGKCQQCGREDDYFANALMDHPLGLVVKGNDKRNIFFYDNGSKSVRCLISSRGRWSVNTLWQWDRYVHFIIFDNTGKYLYLLAGNSIWRIRSHFVTPLEAVISADQGHKDGSLAHALIDRPRSIFFLSDNLFILADYGNNVLRLVDIANSIVSTMCVPQMGADITVAAGPIDRCKMRAPLQVYRRDNNTIAVLAENSLYRVSYSGK